MATLQRAALLPALLVLTCGCERSDASADLARNMLEAMGGRDPLEGVQTIVLRGEGTRTRLGQMAVAGGEDRIATHTNPPDELERRRAAGEAVGGVEVFEGTLTLAEGGQRIVLHEIDAFERAQPMVLAYVPAARVVFQSDLYFGAPTPDAQVLVDAIRGLRMNVETVVGGHGDAVPFRDVVSSFFN